MNYFKNKQQTLLTSQTEGPNVNKTNGTQELSYRSQPLLVKVTYKLQSLQVQQAKI